MHCDHCVRRYERESVAVEAACVASLNYDECDTAMRNCATEWSLRVTATQLLKKGRHGKVCRTIKYSIKVNAWCCLSSVGFGRIICFKNNLTSYFLIM